jgi:LmbE family N-acetylglucosaminyl deacetylase
VNREPGSILAIMAHPDDAELWAGGTLALHAQSATATIAVVQSGESRMREAASGATILGATLQMLPEGTTVSDVRDLLLTVRPDVVITHPLADVHADHRRIAALVLEALPDAVITTGLPRRLYTCDSYNSLTLDGPIRADTIVDIETTFTVKLKALNAHSGTQPIAEHFAPMADTLSHLWGARIGAARAEAYTAVPILGRLPAASHL